MKPEMLWRPMNVHANKRKLSFLKLLIVSITYPLKTPPFQALAESLKRKMNRCVLNLTKLSLQPRVLMNVPKRLLLMLDVWLKNSVKSNNISFLSNALRRHWKYKFMSSQLNSKKPKHTHSREAEKLL